MSFKTGEVKHYFENVGTESAPMFKAVDFSFVNTSLFTEAGDYFNKHKDYEYPIPKDFSGIDTEVIQLLASVSENFFFMPFL